MYNVWCWHRTCTPASPLSAMSCLIPKEVKMRVRAAWIFWTLFYWHNFQFCPVLGKVFCFSGWEWSSSRSCPSSWGLSEWSRGRLVPRQGPVPVGEEWTCYWTSSAGSAGWDVVGPEPRVESVLWRMKAFILVLSESCIFLPFNIMKLWIYYALRKLAFQHGYGHFFHLMPLLLSHSCMRAVNI